MGPLGDAESIGHVANSQPLGAVRSRARAFPFGRLGGVFMTGAPAALATL